MIILKAILFRLKSQVS